MRYGRHVWNGATLRQLTILELANILDEQSEAAALHMPAMLDLFRSNEITGAMAERLEEDQLDLGGLYGFRKSYMQRRAGRIEVLEALEKDQFRALFESEPEAETAPVIQWKNLEAVVAEMVKRSRSTVDAQPEAGWWWAKLAYDLAHRMRRRWEGESPESKLEVALGPGGGLQASGSLDEDGPLGHDSENEAEVEAWRFLEARSLRALANATRAIGRLTEAGRLFGEAEQCVAARASGGALTAEVCDLLSLEASLETDRGNWERGIELLELHGQLADGGEWHKGRIKLAKLHYERDDVETAIAISLDLVQQMPAGRMRDAATLNVCLYLVEAGHVQDAEDRLQANKLAGVPDERISWIRAKILAAKGSSEAERHFEIALNRLLAKRNGPLAALVWLEWGLWLVEINRPQDAAEKASLAGAVLQVTDMEREGLAAAVLDLQAKLQQQALTLKVAARLRSVFEAACSGRRA